MRSRMSASKRRRYTMWGREAVKHGNGRERATRPRKPEVSEELRAALEKLRRGERRNVGGGDH